MTTTIVIAVLLIVFDVLLTYAACVNLKKCYWDWYIGLLPIFLLILMVILAGLIEMQNTNSPNELILKIQDPLLVYDMVTVAGLIYIIFLARSKRR